MNIRNVIKPMNVKPIEDFSIKEIDLNHVGIFVDTTLFIAHLPCAGREYNNWRKQRLFGAIYVHQQIVNKNKQNQRFLDREKLYGRGLASELSNWHCDQCSYEIPGQLVVLTQLKRLS